MIISDFNLLSGGGLTKASATIVRENSDKPAINIYVQTTDEFKEYISPDPNSFLLASILTAWKEGEKRVLVKGTLCPVLLNNLEGAFMMLRSWYPGDFGELPLIEASLGLKANIPPVREAVSLMSGGIDSLCLLRSNHLLFPPGHPDRITAVIPIDESQEYAVNRNDFDKAFEGRMTSIKPVTDEAGVKVIPALTNIWWLNTDGYFYGQKSYSSQLSAISSFFANKFFKGYIGSSYDAAFSNKPWGSNPQLDAYYSSSHFRVENSGSEMSRLKKISVVADWPVAFHHIRVCQNDNSGGSNCGTCEKCIRTKLMLESLGKLKDCTSFPENYIDTELLGYLETYNMLPSTDALHNQEKIYQYGLTLPLLKKRGRNDLADALEKILEKLK